MEMTQWLLHSVWRALAMQEPSLALRLLVQCPETTRAAGGDSRRCPNLAARVLAGGIECRTGWRGEALCGGLHE